LPSLTTSSILIFERIEFRVDNPLGQVFSAASFVAATRAARFELTYLPAVRDFQDFERWVG